MSMNTVRGALLSPEVASCGEAAVFDVVGIVFVDVWV